MDYSTMKFVQFWVFLCLLSVEVLHVSESITVKFLNREPLYVEPGRTLVLEAEFQLQPNEQIMFSTWERENSDGEVRLARNNKANNDRTFVEKDGALLRIKGVIKSDYGLYKVIVTATDGIQVTDYRSVIEITNPSTPSLAMKCSVPTQGAQWDSPRFSWQVDGVSVTNETAELDGSLLRLINLGRNYTCVTDSSQGTGKVEVLMKELTPEPGPCLASCCTGLIVFVVLLIIIVLILAAVLIWMCYFRRPDSPRDYNPPLNETPLHNPSNSAQD